PLRGGPCAGRPRRRAGGDRAGAVRGGLIAPPASDRPPSAARCRPTTAGRPRTDLPKVDRGIQIRPGLTDNARDASLGRPPAQLPSAPAGPPIGAVAPRRPAGGARLGSA